MLKFSQRKGLKPIANRLQVESMSSELRISIWNVFDLLLWTRRGFMYAELREPEIQAFSTALWFDFFKRPIDSRPENVYTILAQIREWYFGASWNEVYDFVEWVLRHEKSGQLSMALNAILERELAGYRYIVENITDVTDKDEVKALEEALADNSFPGVRAHLANALAMLSDRRKADYRNSIKESISAVESIAQVITNDSKATLGDALRVLERKRGLHPSLRSGFSALYGYTSNEGSIRHAMLDEPNLNAADAKYFLLSCTSFINYLKSTLY